MNGRSTRISILNILRKEIFPNINTEYPKKRRSTRISIPTFLSYHDSGIGLTPHEKIVKGFNTFLEKFVTYPSKLYSSLKIVLLTLLVSNTQDTQYRQVGQLNVLLGHQHYTKYPQSYLGYLCYQKYTQYPYNVVNPWNFTECFYLNHLALSTRQNFFLKMNSYEDLFCFSTYCVIFFLTIFKLLHRIKKQEL